jgi:hypothetical protein
VMFYGITHSAGWDATVLDDGQWGNGHL